MTNVVVRSDGDALLAWSKDLGVGRDGSVASVVYTDRLVRTDAGWRIAHRVITARGEPLAPYALPPGS